ncbi:MAG: hypothetical protein RLZZ347_221 [Candidatus Parcubacteria bacterium]|jgi:hypothetical protein
MKSVIRTLLVLIAYTLFTLSKQECYAQPVPPIDSYSGVSYPLSTSEWLSTDLPGSYYPWTTSANGPISGKTYATSGYIPNAYQNGRSLLRLILPNPSLRGYPVGYELDFWYCIGTVNPGSTYTFSVNGLQKMSFPTTDVNWHHTNIVMTPFYGGSPTIEFQWYVGHGSGVYSPSMSIDAVKFYYYLPDPGANDLKVVSTNSNQILISWPTNTYPTYMYGGYYDLYSNTNNLAKTGWVKVTNNITLGSNGFVTATITNSGSAQSALVYRLSTQP